MFIDRNFKDLDLEKINEHLLAQDYFAPQLFIIASPIGNIADISLRALYVFNLVATIACEDTRVAHKLLDFYAIKKPLLALHEHNQLECSAKIINILKTNKHCAFICDAGTPGICDPGNILIAKVKESGFSVTAIPGACSLITALSIVADYRFSINLNSFTFFGFLPKKDNQLEHLIINIKANHRISICFASPHQIHQALLILQKFLEPERKICLMRELTKKFEETLVFKAQNISNILSTITIKGELVILISECLDKPAEQLSPLIIQLINSLQQYLPKKIIAKIIKENFGIDHQVVYNFLINKI